MTHRTRTLLTSASAAVLVGSLAACSADTTPEARPSTSTEPSASASASPTPTHTPTPKHPQKPALPDAAKPATRAGAEAFGEYFWDLMNYVYFTGDTPALRRVVQPDCGGCFGMINALEEEYGMGSRYVGARWRFVSSEFVPQSDPTGPFAGRTVATVGQQKLIRRDRGNNTTYPPGRDTVILTLFHRDSGWKISSLEGRSTT